MNNFCLHTALQKGKDLNELHDPAGCHLLVVVSNSFANPVVTSVELTISDICLSDSFYSHKEFDRNSTTARAAAASCDRLLAARCCRLLYTLMCGSTADCYYSIDLRTCCSSSSSISRIQQVYASWRLI